MRRPTAHCCVEPCVQVCAHASSASNLRTLIFCLDERRENLAKPQMGCSKTGLKRHFPVLPFLVFLEFLVFFPCEDFLVFLSVFPFFSRDFRGSAGIRNPCCFGGFPCRFPKKNKERKDRVLQVLTLVAPKRSDS